MVTSPSLLGAAVLRGVVPAEDALAGLVRVRLLRRSNEVHVIERRGVPVAYVKQAGAAARADRDDTAGVEACLLTAVAPLQLAPTPIQEGGSGSVWMSALGGSELASIHEPGLLCAAAAELGRTLARLHSFVVDDLSVPDAATPWPLLEELPQSMAGGAAFPLARLVLDARSHPAVGGALEVARSQWQPTHLVHGDISAGNVLLTGRTADGVASGVRVGLIDFELGGRGCPAVDLTSAVTMLAELAPQGRDLAGVCVASYREAGGPAEPSNPWRCVGALITAWQVALTHGETGAATVRQLVRRAQDLAQGVAA